MERESNTAGPRRDEELKREVASLTHGSPMESRADDERLMEDAGDGEPSPERVFAPFESDVDGELGYADIRARSELARHLRPSIFPADRAAVLACARDEDAPPEVLVALERLPQGEFVNVEAVWEALGGAHEPRTHTSEATPDRAPSEPARQEGAIDVVDDDDTVDVAREAGAAAADDRVRRFSMRFDWRYRLAALPFAVTPESAFVDVHDGRLEAHFGPWAVETPLSNVAGVEVSGPYHVLTTIGPPHLSLTDRGLTFATNRDRGVCIRFRDPVPGIDPIGAVHHPGLTVTVDDVEGLRTLLAERS